MEKDNIILIKSIEFSGKVIRFSKKLKKIEEYDLARQFFKSGTSIGANIYEAQSAESKVDFIHKLKIEDKESEETKYWLILIQNSFKYEESESLMEELMTIKKILGKIISSSKK